MRGALRHPLRTAAQLSRTAATLTVAGFDYLFRHQLGRAPVTRVDRARWHQRWATRTLSSFGVEVTAVGQPPARGLMASNHLTYLDILVLGSRQPLVFVAKAEVRSWPGIGALTRCAGSLFLNREQRGEVARLAAAFAPIIADGLVIALFPEGTSTGGDKVLPFRSSLFEPAAANDWPVTPVWLHYELAPGDGSVADEVCYWRDMTFAPHFVNLMSKHRLRARIVYGPPLEAGLDRKRLAERAHAEVCRLRREFLDSTASSGSEPRGSGTPHERGSSATVEHR